MKATTREIGERFHDHVVRELWLRGSPLIPMYRSADFQIERGENPFGLECKYDGEFRKTGNLYIETEKRLPGQPSEASGIFTYTESCWLFAIGDFERFYILAVKHLRKLAMERRFREGRAERPGDVPTVGMLLPVPLAEEWCICRIDGRKERSNGRHCG